MTSSSITQRLGSKDPLVFLFSPNTPTFQFSCHAIYFTYLTQAPRQNSKQNSSSFPYNSSSPPVLSVPIPSQSAASLWVSPLLLLISIRFLCPNSANSPMKLFQLLSIPSLFPLLWIPNPISPHP